MLRKLMLMLLLGLALCLPTLGGCVDIGEDASDEPQVEIETNGGGAKIN